jgi:hypothetical protein
MVVGSVDSFGGASLDRSVPKESWAGVSRDLQEGLGVPCRRQTFTSRLEERGVAIRVDGYGKVFDRACVVDGGARGDLSRRLPADSRAMVWGRPEGSRCPGARGRITHRSNGTSRNDLQEARSPQEEERRPSYWVFHEKNGKVGSQNRRGRTSAAARDLFGGLGGRQGPLEERTETLSYFVPELV